jgi:hypothetical protein
MNKVEEAVLEWIERNNLSYEKTDWGFITSAFNIKCIPNNQSFPIYKEKNDRIVAEWALAQHIVRLDDWINKRPTLRIEKLSINVETTEDKILVTAKRDDTLIAESELWIEDTCIYWHDTRYHGYHVPGWLSKTLRTVLRLNLNLPIETITNSIDSSYHRIGFRTVEKFDVRDYVRRSKLPSKIPFTNPENIIMWRLVYDSISTV